MNAALINAAAELSALGLIVVGQGSKSSSSYWALSRDEGMLRIRLSDHGVAYESSDCAVCVGTAQDDDVRLDLATSTKEAIRRSVKMLVEAEIAAHRERAIELYDSEEEANDAEAFVRKHWGHLI